MLIHTQPPSRRQAAEQTGGWWAAENAVYISYTYPTCITVLRVSMISQVIITVPQWIQYKVEDK